MRVLIADDDPTYRSLLGGLLTSWDFEAMVVSNGSDALKVIRGADPPRLIILDWDMPKADGFEVAKAVRAEEGDNNPYILMITGSRRKRELMRVLVCGADDYLIKPFDPMDLKIHLRSAMRILQLQEDLHAATRGTPVPVTSQLGPGPGGTP